MGAYDNWCQRHDARPTFRSARRLPPSHILYRPLLVGDEALEAPSHGRTWHTTPKDYEKMQNTGGPLVVNIMKGHYTGNLSRLGSVMILQHFKDVSIIHTTEAQRVSAASTVKLHQ